MMGALMVLPEREVGNYFYKKAVTYAKERKLADSLQCFVDAFLMRGEDGQCGDSLWLDFFRLQFTIYLLGKKRVCCSLCEGDMVHDFLKSQYRDLMDSFSRSEIPFKGDLHQWFASYEVDFPWLTGCLDDGFCLC